MLGFKASDLGHRPRKPGLATTARAATVITGVVSAVVVARTAVPYSASVIAASIPVVRAWLAPPFLFVAIHFIILIIWKLSENKHEDDTPSLNHDKPLAKIASPEFPLTAAVEDFAESEVIIPNNYPEFDRSMSEQNSGVDKKLTSLEIGKSDFTKMSAEEPPVVLVGAEDDSMEARWKAIMQGGAAPVLRFTLPVGIGEGGIWIIPDRAEAHSSNSCKSQVNRNQHATLKQYISNHSTKNKKEITHKIYVVEVSEDLNKRYRRI